MSGRFAMLSTALLVAMACNGQAVAGVTADEAAALKTTLTPLGAERAGSPDGAIPPWQGDAPAPSLAAAGARPDPFVNERPLFSISAGNLDQYADKLTDGTKALMRKYPQTYRIDVYPTHRTAAAPQRIYDATFRNATSARLVDSAAGPVPSDAYAGIPFPIPKSGAEVIWNHLLRWRGESFQYQYANYMVTADGKRIVVDGGTFDTQQLYYNPEGSVAQFVGEYVVVRITTESPPDRKGLGYVERSHVNADKSSAWVYLPGQRRVRKLPNSCCDTPLPSSAGVITSDEPDVWNGRIDRSDWRLIGKAQMYIPYNANRSLLPSVDELLGTSHLNPNHVRWELHRVWVVEATLARGKSHAMARSRYYLDEDTWTAVLADRWDVNGVLARTLWALPLLLSDVPAVAAATSGGHDLVAGTWIAMAVLNGKPAPYKIVPRFPDAHFTPDALAGEGIR